MTNLANPGHLHRGHLDLALVSQAEAWTVHRIADRELDGRIGAAFGPSPVLERANTSVGSRHKAGAPAFADYLEKAGTAWPTFHCPCTGFWIFRPGYPESDKVKEKRSLSAYCLLAVSMIGMVDSQVESHHLSLGFYPVVGTVVL